LCNHIKNVGKQALEQSGKYPVNENDEEISGQVRSFARITTGLDRHGRARPGHPRLLSYERRKTWMPGTSPGMTPSLLILSF
jgi:hypothetical protein